MYPEDCVQSIIQPDPWWISNTDKVLCRGALIFAFDNCGQLSGHHVLRFSDIWIFPTIFPVGGQRRRVSTPAPETLSPTAQTLPHLDW